MNKINKIVILASILMISTPAMAIQSWMLKVGKASTASLGVSISDTKGEKPPKKWNKTTKDAVKAWDAVPKLSPFMQTLGFHNVIVRQLARGVPGSCGGGLACVKISRSKSVECVINVMPAANSKSGSHRKMVMLHELGHCYGLGHNTSGKELMHCVGCPAFPSSNKCGITTQAKAVIARRY